MQLLALVAYALAAGLTLCGLVGTLAEISSGRRLGFRPPFVVKEHFARSLALTVGAGPFMLVNEALAARRAGLINASVLTMWSALSVVWAMAAGVLIVELALIAATLLG